MTIPSLVVQQRKKETATKLLKTYNTLVQAVKMSEVENGNIKSWNFNIPQNNPAEMDKFLSVYLEPYLKIQRKCVGQKGCFSNQYDADHSYAGLYSGLFGVAYILNDSTLLSINNVNGGIWVMVNVWGPNNYKVGKDIFIFNFNNNGISTQAQGQDRDYYLHNAGKWSCNKESNRERCSGLIQADGWEIRDDYPW